MFEKTHVARHKQPHALFQALAAESGEYPSWNFHKYLVSRDGRVVGSYRSGVRPQDPELVSAIEAEL
jgi:glutathione peroxidase